MSQSQGYYPDDRDTFPFQYSLAAWVNLAIDLYSKGRSDVSARLQFVRFMLAGRQSVDEDGLETRTATLNPCQGLNPLRSDRLQVSRDFDSLIGSTLDFPYTVSVAVFPVPAFRETLTQANHVKALAYNSMVSRIRIL